MVAKKSPALVHEFLERISGSVLEDQYRHVVAVGGGHGPLEPCFDSAINRTLRA